MFSSRWCCNYGVFFFAAHISREIFENSPRWPSLIRVCLCLWYFMDTHRSLCTYPCSVHSVSAHLMFLSSASSLFWLIPPVLWSSVHLRPHVFVTIFLLLSVHYLFFMSPCVLFPCVSSWAAVIFGYIMAFLLYQYLKNIISNRCSFLS